MKLRNCDLIEGMDYIKTCPVCNGDGEYDQTYNIGCGGGYITMSGPCEPCKRLGILTIDGKPVTESVIAQIRYRRETAILNEQIKRLAAVNHTIAQDPESPF